eukprot:gnl/TRDRNA2_/TRDRNA2_119835_c2_seq1.p1 gnl/TRDRNA2_/TRDRNA2_119835_c2~~gnl/TRDRNA2_/TRDRNA2_119835_c2_seq1.p1  ORF type:complete len:245 (+),score=23.30 gnl/TRDRNA2_/TRDRNA2_119835_c2_seq1:99-737(+)
MDGIDGVFTETWDLGSIGYANAGGFMGMRSPVIVWTYETPLPDDAYMQRHLLMKVMPMAPVLGADHCISPSAEASKVYTDYGPLFKLLRGARWLLNVQNPVQLADLGANASANLFHKVDMLLLVITGATVGSTGLMDLAISSEIYLCGPAGRKCDCSVHQPGGSTDVVRCFRTVSSNPWACSVPTARAGFAFLVCPAAKATSTQMRAEEFVV